MNLTHDIASDPALRQEPRNLSKGGFAKLIKVSAGRVSQMITAGMPVERDGSLDVSRCKLWVAENINPTRAAAQAQGATLFGEERQQVSLTAERARLAKEQADSAELKNAVLRRDLVVASEVEREWATVLRKVRSGVLAVPARMRQTLPHLTPHDVLTFDAELRRVLEDLANDQ